MMARQAAWRCSRRASRVASRRFSSSRFQNMIRFIQLDTTTASKWGTRKIEEPISAAAMVRINDNVAVEEGSEQQPFQNQPYQPVTPCTYKPDSIVPHTIPTSLFSLTLGYDTIRPQTQLVTRTVSSRLGGKEPERPPEFAKVAAEPTSLETR